jgi:cobalamin biosynthetic protein CobC
MNDALPRDHGGDLGAAIARYGADGPVWIDLSTGVNRRPYPAPPLPLDVWTRLPQAEPLAALIEAARGLYGAAGCVVAAPGAQALIQLAPRLAPPGSVAVVSPTYNEHAAAFTAEGWTVRAVTEPEEAGPDEALVVVNPNNPDGRPWPAARLARLADRPLLVVDESFADADPAQSLAALAAPNLVVLRSFGKFFGLAGLRLGFAICSPSMAADLQRMLGPWAVSGPAIAIGTQALSDAEWIAAARAELAADAARLDRLAAKTGWSLVGGTALFRTYDAGCAAHAQDRLAARRIWTRRFPYSAGWLRIGLPGAPEEWARVAEALA